MEQTYQKIILASQNGAGILYEVTGKTLLEVFAVFPPYLQQVAAPVDLAMLYTVQLHRPSGALLIASKGAALLTKAGFTHRPMVVNHIGCAVYLPQHGVEMVDIATVGNLETNRIIVRAESACAPSFLFGSQRCNCHDQWLLTQELAAYFHAVDLPSLSAEQLEEWVIDQAQHHEEDKPGFVLLHFGSQNGMGSGATEGQFIDDLTSTSWLRHRGEYTAEQAEKTSMAGGFRSIGLSPDPRLLNDRAGYRIIPIILDFLNVTKSDLFLLTNNQSKITVVQEAGYHVTAVPVFGRIDVADERETVDRRDEFQHCIPTQLSHMHWPEELKILIDQCAK